ncbi:synaptopodin-2 isoform X2 [Mugil cephalus]|uniref:synaptopodin-2 isoform X2 n=1 Tax=Mugil cephalus TaxID=48193 RepID=UPI001FB60B95|nr:synaptopodin-2 isoform X2 [Mugil cephalus]
MEPGAEDIHNTDNLSPWSDSEGSHEFCVSESLAESYSDDDVSEEESPFEPQTALTAKSDPESSKHIQEVGVWESTGEQLPGSEEEVSYQEEEDIYHTESRESSTESPHDQTSQTSVSPHAESEPPAGQISRPHSSSSSLGCAAHMTLALTLTTEQPQGASNRHGPGTGNRRVESSEEGGSSEAPPASVFFGISDEGAEQAEKWNSETDTDLCRPDRHRTRSTRLSHIESPSQRHVKETKSKCKRIARLLTDAPNPQNKGALLFKKRRQRVKKYTLVSYGTGDNELDSEGQIGEEAEEVRSAGYNLVATSDSELEEQYSLHQQQQHNLSVNRGSVGEMDALPETSGKGVMMFAQRRKRMDEIQLEHEEMRSKALTVEALPEPECTEAQNMYDTEEMYMSDDQANYMDSNLRQHVDYQDNIPHMNNFGSKALVPNRTAKPFPGFQHGKSAPIKPVSIAPVMKKHEPRFKVPVPINTNPQVWSPTGDIIASRDERISVPAIKTGNMPESKRKPASKQSPMQQRSDLQVQNKGDRRSYIEPEEDFFSLGAEACNFMQPRTVKLKHPPPVAPKPVINPSCPPWMRRSPSSEPCIPPRSPQPPRSPVPHSQHYLQQQDWAHPQQMANRWAADQTQATLQTPATAWAPVNSSSQLHPQPTTNSWSQQPPRSPVSMQACSPTYSPHYPPQPSRNMSDTTPNSVASYPPQAGKPYVHAPKAPQGSSRVWVSNRGVNRSGDGPMSGRGAELFAKRQSRMEKFIVDDETVQANKTRSPSPTSSLPNSWRYSTNVRAPPPVSYNPLLSPSYPQSAAKQPPATSPKIKPKTKEKAKSAPKQLNALDIMKHQPYQLDSSLFKYDAVPEAKSHSPKAAPVSKFEATKKLKQRSLSSHPSYNTSELAAQSKAEAPAKSRGSVSSQNSSAQFAVSAKLLATDKHLDDKHTVTPAAHHIANKQAPSARPASTTSQQSSTGDSIASAFSPASLIARGARQMAPRPKFSAKKPVATGKQWKPVAMLH